MTPEALRETAVNLAYSVGIPTFIIRDVLGAVRIVNRPTDEHEVIGRIDPPKTAHSSESHGRFTIAAAAKP